ncbi:MAG: META domain-containing protein [Winogradskyella sp.]|uniref:META domain-containing protein n=1 Tax=Winogradskyella sp. TaxID=1883156 RepID=UPI00385EE847
MKHISIILLFITGFSSAQNDLIGEWYLDSMLIDNATYNNVYPFVNNIIFSEDIAFENFLEYDGTSTCNAFFGYYISTTAEIEFYSLGMTAMDCGNAPRATFENIYFALLSNNFTESSAFTYVITGEGDNQTLILTNANGDKIFYNKQETTVSLHSTWYLDTVTENGTTFNGLSSNSPSLTLLNNVHPFFGSISFQGTGVCNDFEGDYNMYVNNGDNLRINNFIPTTNVCDPISALETAYFSILSNPEFNVFTFEITNNGDHLILTPTGDLERSTDINNSIVFRKQALSINEFDYNAIALIENPVKDQLELNIANNLLSQNLTYRIYSANGKLISKSRRYENGINVSTFSTGLYFISLETDNGVLTTLKFVKE